MNLKDCPLCLTDGGHCLYRAEHLRIIAPMEDGLPGLIRVVWHQHVVEMSDLKPLDRAYIMDIVCQVEEIVRRVMQADKINLAAFGNAVPHLHWHVIPRWLNDVYFPQPIWGTAQRPINPADQILRQQKEKQLLIAIEQHFAQITPSLS